MVVERDSAWRDIEELDETTQANYRTYLVRFIVDAESFTVTRILSLIEMRVSSMQDEMVDAMFKNVRGGIERNWESITKSAKEYLGVNLKSIESYKDLIGYVDVRNAAMHGNGYLTRMQQADQRVYQRLEAIDVSLDHNRVVLSLADVRKCALAARSFIIGVDGLTWSPGQNIEN